MELQNNRIILKSLTIDDSEAFYKLYFQENSTADKRISEFNNSPEQFTEHLISLCDFIFTIRLNDDPQKIIGDCALHHWNKHKGEIEIGGTLDPDFWGKGIMKSAFELLIRFVKHEHNMKTIVTKTEADNTKAIRFAEKLGFKNVLRSKNIVTLIHNI